MFKLLFLGLIIAPMLQASYPDDRGCRTRSPRPSTPDGCRTKSPRPATPPSPATKD